MYFKTDFIYAYSQKKTLPHFRIFNKVSYKLSEWADTNELKLFKWDNASYTLIRKICAVTKNLNFV